jgi:uncharacterized membrane protein
MFMNPFILIGLLAILPGCVAIYLASPNQCWLARPWPARRARIAGLLLWIGGLAALLQALQPAAAGFVFSHWLMLLFVLFPYLGAWLGWRRRVHQ